MKYSRQKLLRGDAQHLARGRRRDEERPRGGVDDHARVEVGPRRYGDVDEAAHGRVRVVHKAGPVGLLEVEAHDVVDRALRVIRRVR